VDALSTLLERLYFLNIFQGVTCTGAQLPAYALQNLLIAIFLFIVFDGAYVPRMV
jgi:hypothetical protein